MENVDIKNVREMNMSGNENVVADKNFKGVSDTIDVRADIVMADAMKQKEKRDELIADTFKEIEKPVEELVNETASEESRTRIKVKDRKELAGLIKEAKSKNQKYRVSRSLEEGFRYDFEILDTVPVVKTMNEEDSKIEKVPPELLLNLNDRFQDKLYIEKEYNVKIDNVTSNQGLTIYGTEENLKKLAKDYNIKQKIRKMNESIEHPVECVFIEGKREAYGAEYLDDKTATVGELIEILENYDEDLKVFIRNDNGYTFGSINSDSIASGAYNSDGESELLENSHKPSDKETMHEEVNEEEVFISVKDALKRLVDKFGNKKQQYKLVAEKYNPFDSGDVYSESFYAPNDYIALFSMILHKAPSVKNFERAGWSGDDIIKDFADELPTYEDFYNYAASEWWGDADDYIISLKNLTSGKTLYEAEYDFSESEDDDYDFDDEEEFDENLKDNSTTIKTIQELEKELDEAREFNPIEVEGTVGSLFNTDKVRGIIDANAYDLSKLKTELLKVLEDAVKDKVYAKHVSDLKKAMMIVQKARSLPQLFSTITTYMTAIKTTDKDKQLKKELVTEDVEELSYEITEPSGTVEEAIRRIVESSKDEWADVDFVIPALSEEGFDMTKEEIADIAQNRLGLTVRVVTTKGWPYPVIITTKTVEELESDPVFRKEYLGDNIEEKSEFEDHIWGE